MIGIVHLLRHGLALIQVMNIWTFRFGHGSIGRQIG